MSDETNETTLDQLSTPAPETVSQDEILPVETPPPVEDLSAPVVLNFGQVKFIKEFLRDYFEDRTDLRRLDKLKELFGAL